MEIEEKKSRVKTTFSTLFLFRILAVCVIAFGLVRTTNAAEKSHVEFVSIPGNGSDVKPFKIGKTEVTNEQYVEFLNKALLAGKISVGKVTPTLDKAGMLNTGKVRKPEVGKAGGTKAKRPRRALIGFKSRNQQFILDANGNRMIDLMGLRVTGDHNRNGKYELWEMENPLNRVMIQYDANHKIFSVVNPEKVDWRIYFDENNLPKGVVAVDTVENWAELQKFWKDGTPLKGRKVVSWVRGDYDKDVLFAGHFDLDFKLPSHDEVKRWPVNHITYYAAKAFADFYNYDLPTFQEFQWAAAGGKGYVYGSNDGTISSKNIVYSGHSIKKYSVLKNRKFIFAKFPGKGKGHVQPVASKPANPYGVYDLSGNVYEWTKTKNSKELNCWDKVKGASDSFVRIGGSWNYYDLANSTATSECKNTGVSVANDHFGFRVVKR